MPRKGLAAANKRAFTRRWWALPAAKLICPAQHRLERPLEGDRASIDAISQVVDHPASPSHGVYAWQEHDDLDQAEPVIVLLCTACSDRLIEPHPRLYRRLDRNWPCVGTMPLCLECACRAGVRSVCPEAHINGGPGLRLEHDHPISTHLNYGVGRGGATFTVYPNPVRSCSGWQSVPGTGAV